MATDAIARKPRKTKSPSKTDSSLTAQDTQFILTSAHVVKLHAERFLSPAEAKKGVYTLAQTCGRLFTADVPNPFGKFTYEMTLEGFAVNSEGKKDLEKRSFKVSIAMEAKFDIVNGKISKVDELNKLCPEVIGQVHALGTMRLIALAADLGFPGVRPRLSIPRESIPCFTPDGTTESPGENE